MKEIQAKVISAISNAFSSMYYIDLRDNTIQAFAILYEKLVRSIRHFMRK